MIDQEMPSRGGGRESLLTQVNQVGVVDHGYQVIER